MERILTVKGTGSLEIKPDQVEIKLSVEAKDKDYEKSVEAAAKSVSDLSDAFSEIGLDKTALKTVNWECEQVFRKVQVTKKVHGKEEREWQSVFDFYRTEHLLKLVFGFGEIELPEVIGAIANCSSVPEFEVGFTIKDKESAANSLITAATKDAMEKAALIAEASNIVLGKPLTIQYDWGEYYSVQKTESFFSGTRMRPFSSRRDIYNMEDMMFKCDSIDIDVQPENIWLRDTITFAWEIK